MVDAYFKARDLAQNPGRNQTSSDDEHPFLTPKGLRLQRDGSHIPGVAPIEFPTYPQPAAPRRQKADPVAPVDPFDFSRGQDQPLLNILPSAKFPNPDVLAQAPLSPYFDWRLVTNPMASPLRAVGRLFIQLMDERFAELASGSAWISGPSTIVTCAHNVFEFATQRWSKALQFHAAYDYYDDQRPEFCRITSCYIPRAYMGNPATNHDIAICTVDRPIGEIVGAQIAMRPVQNNDFFDTNPVAIVGFPAGSGFDFGKQMWQSRGDYLFGQSNGPGSDCAPAIATNFGGGASGCPWLVKEPFTGEYVAVGLTSGHAKLRYLRGESNLMSLVSPFFGLRLMGMLESDRVYHRFDS